jgi:acyl-CoA synthetase (AMP-forming)/AMP-acid ligase II
VKLSYVHGVRTTALIVDTIGGALNGAAERLRDGVTATAEEFRDFCRGQIATYKIPRYVRFTTEFPMTVTGKVKKFKMRELTVAEPTLARVTDVEPT